MQIRLATLLALALAAPAFAGDVAGVHEVSDRNHDGVVDRAEFQKRQKDLFLFDDTDKDGSLSAKELGGGKAAKEVIRAGDRNGDGKLQMQEFLDVRAKAFQRADRDKSGTLSMDEVEAVEE